MPRREAGQAPAPPSLAAGVQASNGRRGAGTSAAGRRCPLTRVTRDATVAVDSTGRRGGMPERAVYIAGVAEGPLGKVPDHSELSMMGLAARAALAEAGLTERDVDGLFVRYRTTEPLVEHTVEFGEYIGIRPRYADSTDIGGGSFEAFVHHAMLAVAAGRCDVALLAYASRQRSRRSRSMLVPPDDYSLSGQFEAPYGIHAPSGQYARIAARHKPQCGAT